MTNRILFEDNHLLIVNKLPGEIVQGDKTGDEPLVESLKSYLKVKYNKPGAVFLGVVHRLDRPVSGAVVFARTSKALSRMNAMLQKREMRKVYWAISPFVGCHTNPSPARSAPRKPLSNDHVLAADRARRIRTVTPVNSSVKVRMSFLWCLSPRWNSRYLEAAHS